MPLARAIIRGLCLKERLAVNGSHHASRSLGAVRSLAALELADITIPGLTGRVRRTLANFEGRFQGAGAVFGSPRPMLCSPAKLKPNLSRWVLPTNPSLPAPRPAIVEKTREPRPT